MTFYLYIGVTSDVPVRPKNGNERGGEEEKEGEGQEGSELVRRGREK